MSNNEETRFLTLSWKEIEDALMTLAEKIINSDYKPQAVIGIMRGGWIPARVLADLLDVKSMGAIEIKFYRGIEERHERPVITQPLVLDIKDKNVLIIDDVADTGKSLQIAVNAINLHGPKSIRTASLYVKPWSVMMPDYYYAQTDKWIIFPWENREIIEELISAEYKTLPRTAKDIDEVARQLSKKTGLTLETVLKILRMMVKNL